MELDKPDPFLTALDEIQRQLNHLRDEYLAQKFSMQNQTVEHRVDSLTVAEVAEKLALNAGTVRDGNGGTRCLYQARIRNGKAIRYAHDLVNIHLRNLRQNGKCGTCYEEYRKQ